MSPSYVPCERLRRGGGGVLKRSYEAARARVYVQLTGKQKTEISTGRYTQEGGIRSEYVAPLCDDGLSYCFLFPFPSHLVIIY